MSKIIGQTAVSVYPLSNYSFGSKEIKHEKDINMDQRMARLRQSYEKLGLRRTVEGVLVVQEHNHPHILLLQRGVAFFKLPGGRLRPGEDEVSGLKRKLTNALAPANPQLRISWDVGECVGTQWRPNFDNVFYPYLPPHITKPKEYKRMYMIPLPDKAVFAVPGNMKLVAVPLFELYDNPGRFGPSLASLPAMLSRFRLNVVGSVVPTAYPQTLHMASYNIPEQAPQSLLMDSAHYQFQQKQQQE
ncbi:hypothetical protein CEUSTIGMA_g2387.t1 [Chlamydomonas eustigma]|uniref:Cleavage and polyadenylation specificity factor subunit 5 n=1 Tax=Chlamydomonas eustigma TaxID=1157962 RepID=A0A250WVU7_9CHLO|nr:hypothetical protein CEUSTIGMA_g2387.t1 [Chlamydomonas eustigma]|eukprot:GAX74941.1 hypothetical protein CEUSTIGMA_g2387.t1 [Chlamydomonas eustigma]